jgi:hypothetical protein
MKSMETCNQVLAGFSVRAKRDNQGQASMKKIIFVIVCMVLLFFCRRVFCIDEYKTDEEEAEAYNVTRTIKTVEGLRFSVQEDRPIEKVGGVYRPLDMDSYVAMKINKLDKKISDLKEATNKQFEELAKEMSKLAQKFQDVAERQKAIKGDQAVVSLASEKDAKAAEKKEKGENIKK